MSNRTQTNFANDLLLTEWYIAFIVFQVFETIRYHNKPRQTMFKSSRTFAKPWYMQNYFQK